MACEHQLGYSYAVHADKGHMELKWHILGVLADHKKTKQTKASQRLLTNLFTFKPSGLKEHAVLYRGGELVRDEASPNARENRAQPAHSSILILKCVLGSQK